MKKNFLFNFLTVAKELKKLGVMGVNDRNGNFLLPYNSRKYYPLVDDKLLTKNLAAKLGISVPKLYYDFSFSGEVKNLSKITEPYQEFVIKPARGSGGEGIVVVNSRRKGSYLLSDGSLLSEEDLAYHIRTIISGLYSLGGQPDHALMEYKVNFDPVFKDVAFQGVPDVRIIVFQGIPAMSMVRLPTKISKGKANLHQGAIGVGLNLENGQAVSAVWKDMPIDEHPDTGASISSVKVPNWDRLLEIASSCTEMVNLGYIGVDIVLDKNLGPMILELNARPGLAIQIANNQGIKKRLNYITKKLASNKNLSLEDRLSISKELSRI